MTNKSPPFDPSVYVHSPSALGVMHLEHYEYLLEHPGIRWDVPTMDRLIIPMRPGDLTLIVGRPGSGKTSLLARQAKLVASDIARREAQLEECVVYVSWEQHAEELEAYFQSDDTYTHTDYAWGRVSIEDVRRKTFSRAKLPLWVIGHSRKHVRGQSKPLTLEIVFAAIESMVHDYDNAPRPVLLCLDYAQIIPGNLRIPNRYQQVKEIVRETKLLALRIGCPVLVAAQARREVDSYSLRLPGMADGYESSGLEHEPDKFLGIARPWKFATHYSTIDVAGHAVQVTPDLVLIRLAKQRGDDGDKIFILRFDPASLRLDDLELQQQAPIY